MGGKIEHHYVIEIELFGRPHQVASAGNVTIARAAMAAAIACYPSNAIIMRHGATITARHVPDVQSGAGNDALRP